MLKEF